MPQFLKNKKQLSEISDFQYIHGKWTYRMEPGFCGGMNRVPEKKFPDKVEFRSQQALTEEQKYQLKLESGVIIDIVVKEIADGEIVGEVVE